MEREKEKFDYAFFLFAISPYYIRRGRYFSPSLYISHFFFFLCHYRQDSIAEIEKQFKEGLEGGDKMCVHERQLAHHLQKVQTIAVYKNIILIAFKHDLSLAAEKTFFLVASSSFCQRFR